MDLPIMKITKILAEALGFPEEPSMKFLRNYVFNMKILNNHYNFSIEKRELLKLKTNIFLLKSLDIIYNKERFITEKTEDVITFRIPITTFNSGLLYIKRPYVENLVTYHYEYTNYRAYSKSYKILNSPDSKDYKPEIVQKIKEKIYHYLDKLNQIFKSQKKVIWNNLIELCDFDISNLDIDLNNYKVDKPSMVKNFMKLDYDLESVFEKKPELEKIYNDIVESKYFFSTKYYINLLDDVLKFDKILTYLQLIQHMNSFGRKSAAIILETGLPF